ncbi:phospho-3-sulfolactate synthase [Hypoxylon sp. EC38]|nr:phospho-3-sulfolactate synthase [Hypoxylon sp. EC38]
MATPLRSAAATALRQARACKPSSMRTPRSALLTTTATAPSRPFTATAAAATLSSPASPIKTLIDDRDSGFGFVRHNPAPPKPRTRSVTEIRGPYYTVMGPRYLSDVLETMGPYVDGLKFAGGSFSLFSEGPLRQLIDLAHANGVYVSTGGWIEHILASSGGDVGGAVDKYLAKCKDLGFDVIELSTGFLSLPPDDWVRLVDRVHDAGLEPKPELGIQFGAGGDTAAAELESLGTSDPSKLINMAERFLDAGVERVMIESEGITENVKTWRTDVIHSVLKELSFEQVMFEAADPAVFNWYIREFGVDVNLFVDHSQIVQLAGLRAGIWGKSDTFGKITTFRP